MRQTLQTSQQALETSQQQLAVATAEQQQLSSQVADLQLQLEGSVAENRDSQSALHAVEAKLSASQSDLTSTQTQVHLFAVHLIAQVMSWALSGNSRSQQSMLMLFLNRLHSRSGIVSFVYGLFRSIGKVSSYLPEL